MYYGVARSSGQSVGDTASLKLPLSNFYDCYCVQFAYNMHGVGIGALKVQEMNGNTMSTVWEMYGGKTIALTILYSSLIPRNTELILIIFNFCIQIKAWRIKTSGSELHFQPTRTRTQLDSRQR